VSILASGHISQQGSRLRPRKIHGCSNLASVPQPFCVFGSAGLDQIFEAAEHGSGRSCHNPVDHRPRDETNASIGPAEALRIEGGILADDEPFGNLDAAIDDHVFQPR